MVAWGWERDARLIPQGGKTLMRLTMKFASKQIRDGALASGMEHGMSIGYGQLDAMFAAGAIA